MGFNHALIAHKERPRNGTFGFRSLLLNRTEMLATQANDPCGPARNFVSGRTGKYMDYGQDAKYFPVQPNLVNKYVVLTERRPSV